MSNKVRIASVCLLLIIAAQTYLTWHYYPANFGGDTGSMSCNINETLNCDASTTSSYSNIAGLPISILGGVTALITLVLLAMSAWGWTDEPEKTSRLSFYLSVVMGLASIVMALISSLILKTYCPYCIAAYVFSFAVLALLFKETSGLNASNFAGDIKSLFGPSKAHLGILIVIPASAFLLHQSFLGFFGVSGIQDVVNSSIASWNSSPLVKFDSSASLSKGPERDAAKMTIVEFADFRCSHCKMAAPILKTFQRSHKDVRVEFFSFPLDGSCNPSPGMQAGDGISCRLAKSVFCVGQKDSGKGWDLHDYLFETQSASQDFHSATDVDKHIQPWTEKQGVSFEEVKTCMDSEDTHKAISRQAKIGDLAQVQGTPTIYVNGRKLSRGQFIPVLDGVRKSLIK